jgi:hypothetical protein
LQANLQVFTVERDRFAADLQVNGALGLHLGEEFAAVGSAEDFLALGKQLADPGAEAFEVGLDLVGDVFRRVFGVFDLLDVELVTQ